MESLTAVDADQVGKAVSKPRANTSETTFFLLTIFIGLHTGVAITSGGKVVVPFVICFIGALGVLFVNLNRVTNRIVNWFIRLSFVMILVAVAVSARNGLLGEHVKSTLVLIYAVGIGYAAFVGFTVMGQRRIEETFFWVSLILIFGAAMEVYGPLKPVSDWFRDIVNAGRSNYGSDLRDLSLYGAARPNFFASEPSIMGMDTGIALSLWFGCKQKFDFSSFLIGGFLFLAALFFIRSPNVIFGPIALFLLWLMTAKGGGRFIKMIRYSLVAGYMLAAVALPGLSFLALLYLPVLPRYMTTFSFIERIVAPFFMAASTIRTSPIVGIGLGSDDVKNQLALQIFAATGILSARPDLVNTDVGHLVDNVFWEFWMFLGLAGGGLLIWTVRDFLKTLRVPRSGYLILALTGVTFWQGMGGINTPLAWFTLFLMAALFTLREGPAPLRRRPKRRTAERMQSVGS